MRPPLATIATAALLLVAGACGGDDDDGDADQPPSVPPADGGAALSPEAAAGHQLAKDSGCAGCHGADFSGSLGPSWVGLYGSNVTLDDGSTVIADDTYLTTAIQDPAAQRVAEFSLAMPENDLTPEQVAQIVAYIRELAPG